MGVYQKLRAKLRTPGVLIGDAGVYRMAEGYLFRSPSAAAAAHLGRTANGRIEWKDGNGVTLRDRQAAELPAT